MIGLKITEGSSTDDYEDYIYISGLRHMSIVNFPIMGLTTPVSLSKKKYIESSAAIEQDCMSCIL